MRKFIIFIGIFILYTNLLVAKEKYALIIGINTYLDSRIRDLHYSEADARYLRDVLIRYARYKRTNIKMLLGIEATYQTIKKEIYWLGENAKKEDDVLFYFSGHGTRVEDKDGNEDDGMDEAFCPYETNINNPASVILDDEIGHWFRRIQSDQILVFLDCCHSGGAAGRSLEQDESKGLEMSTSSTSRNLLDFDDDPYAKDLTIHNKFIITASDAHEKSYENPSLGHGVFTYYVGEAIKGEADVNEDMNVTSGELYDYTKQKTLEFALSINRTQTPMRFGVLEDAIVAEINKQLCNLRLYDRDLKIVYLGIGGDLVNIGDLFLIKKSYESYVRDLELADENIFQVQITGIQEDNSKAKITKEYYQGIHIDPSRYNEYYAEKIIMGSLYIITEPWSTVYLDGQLVGETPLTIHDVPEGDYDLEFRISQMGYPKNIPKKITIEGNKKLRIVEKFNKQE